MSKKILYVINEPAYFLLHRLPIAQAAVNQGLEVHVAAADSIAAQSIRDNGFHFHPIPFTRSGTNPLEEMQCFLKLFHLYRKLRPHLLHHYTIKPMLYGSIAARLAQIPAVVNAVIGMGYVFVEGDLRRKILRGFVLKGYQHAFRIPNMRMIFENPDDRNYFVTKKLVPDEKTALIKSPGVDINHFVLEPEGNGIPKVVLAARLLWDKGVREFVEAANRLRNEGIMARFVLVGDTDKGNPSGIPRSQLKVWAAEGVVEWWGFQKNMKEILRQCSIFCLPSYYREGIPRVLLEAAATGRPLVTTDHPGCRESVIHNETGILVPPRSVDGLADALRKLILDPDLRHRMGSKGRKWVEKEFSIEQVIRQTLGVYEELLKEKYYHA